MKKAIGLEVKVTNRCNLRCYHCMNRDGWDVQGDLDTDLLVAKLKTWSRRRNTSDFQISEIRLTGGEPLIRLEATLNIAQTCRKLGIKVGVNTNGTLLNQHVAQRLKEAGISVVKISIDSFDDAVLRNKMGPGIRVKPILEAISTAVEIGFEVIMRFTLSRINRHELISCYNWGRKLGVGLIQVKPMIQSGRAIGSADLLSERETTAALQSLAHAVSQRNESDIVQVLCWPPDKAGGLKSKRCGSVDKLYAYTDLKVTICNFIHSHILYEDLAENSLETVLANREANINKFSCDHGLVTGCPLLPLFR